MRFPLALTLLASVAPSALAAQTDPSAAPAPAPARQKPGANPAPPARQTNAARTATPARQQQNASADANTDEADDVVVTGRRNLPGAVVGDIPPEQSLNPADIRSYGVSSVADLLTELAPQTRSDRGSGGAPVVLLNGRRISGFQEIRDLPTEAIARVDILPEEVALKYGYRADQRVVNFVLRRRFRAFTGELADRQATAGGTNTPQAEADLLRINRDQRLNIHMSYTQTSALTEAERNVQQSPTPFSVAGNILPGPGVTDGQIDPALSLAAGKPLGIVGVPAGAGTPTLGQFAATPQTVTDQGQYRTLIPSSRTFSINSVIARPLTDRATYTLNGKLDVSDTTSLNGLPFARFVVPTGDPFSPFSRDVTLARALDQFNPLEQASNNLTTHLGGTINGDFGRWRYTLTSGYDRVHAETVTDNGLDTGPAQARLTARDPGFNPYGPLPRDVLVPLAGTRALSTSNVGGADALINGPIAKIKAGDVNTSLRVGGQISRYESDSYRFGVTQTGNVKRDTVNGQLNVDLPIADRAHDVLPFLGHLSVNGNLAVDHLSDFGTLKTVGYGANWSPLKPVRLIVSVTDQDEAPSANQLGDPLIVTPNARVFDFTTSQTVIVNRISGGNPMLQQDKRHTFKMGLNVKPFDKTDLTFTANYIATHTDNAISGFPGVTQQFQAAFPGRFTRDPNGNLTQFDARPINFARTERSELRYGFNFSRPLKSRLQKQIEAWRAGKGPNPFAGLTPPRGFGFPGGRDGGRDGQRGGNDAPPPPLGGTNGAAPPPPGGAGGPGPGGGRGFGGPGGGGGRFGGGGQGGGRLQFALYHTWHFTDRVTVAPGATPIDLLNGGSLGANGGQARHELEGQAGYTNNGLGARLSANYASATSVIGGTAMAPSTLRFGSLATVNLRLFADPTGRLDLIRKHPWLRGTRMSLSITNLFDARQRVTDATGATPISYQPDLIDPLGRTVRLSIRKLFFGT